MLERVLLLLFSPGPSPCALESVAEPELFPGVPLRFMQQRGSDLVPALPGHACHELTRAVRIVDVEPGPPDLRVVLRCF
jgi:hypothetical protein